MSAQDAPDGVVVAFPGDDDADPGRSIANALRRADAALEEAAAILAGDAALSPMTAALTLATVEELTAKAKVLVADAKKATRRALDESGVRALEVPGYGVLEQDNGITRDGWKNRELALEVANRLLAQEGVTTPQDFVLRLLDFASLSGWKVGRYVKATGGFDGGLRSIGVTPDEFCNESTRRSVRWKR